MVGTELTRLARNLWRWIKALARWIVYESWPVWAVIVIFGLGFAFVMASPLPSSTANRVRYSGLAFELLGIFTVVWGLRGKRLLFKRPSLIEHFRSWLRRFPRWGGTQHRVLVADGLSLSSAVGKASGWIGVPPGAAVDARLNALESNLAALRREHEEATKEVAENLRNTKEAVDLERQERKSADTALRQQLEGLGAEGLYVETMGVALLALGIVLDTIPAEITGWFGR